MSMIYTADAVVFAGDRPNRSVLLIRRAWPPFEGHWALPGGHVDEGESPTTAAYRELAEETGLALPVNTLAHVGTYNRPGRDPRGPYATDAYVGELPAPVAVGAADDAADARWIAEDDLLDMEACPLAFDHRSILHEAAVALLDLRDSRAPVNIATGNARVGVQYGPSYRHLGKEYDQ